MRTLRLLVLAAVASAAAAGSVYAQACEGGAFVPSCDYNLSGQWVFGRYGGSDLCFEGATNNGFETCISSVDPTADRILSLPNATDTLVGKATTDTLTNKTLTAPVITSPIVTNAMVAGGSSLVLTAAVHGGKTIALDTAAGTAIVLPAATGSGVTFTFVVTVAATSNQHRISVVGNDAFYGGIFGGNDSDNTMVMWPTAADADRINFEGTAGTQGGVKGAIVIVQDIVADGWSVIGWTDAVGSEATPFVTGAVS